MAVEDLAPAPEPTAVTETPEPTEDPTSTEASDPSEAATDQPQARAAVAAVAAQPPVARTAGIKLVSATTNTWGTVATDVPLPVRTEVQLDDGRWVRSQTSTTDATGWFVIPLTYGANTSGVRQWRVAAEHPSGEVTRSAEFSLRRVTAPTAATAGTKQVRALTYAWGTVDPLGLQSVQTEVQLADGRWARSQTGATDARGYYTLPLTYGAATAGTYR